MEYALPFFPDYTIEYPLTYDGETDNFGYIIRKNGKVIKPKYDFRGEKRSVPYYVLNNPQSKDPEYNKLYKKNVVGTYTQTLYNRNFRDAFFYLKHNNIKPI